MRRALNGVLLLDKPAGMTSQNAVHQVKRLFLAEKAGHTGSLDPLATGLLPICFGEATKFSQFLLNADKTYQVTARLGSTTTTGDAEGEVLETRPVPHLTVLELQRACEKFLGISQQIPPMYSALKHQGQPLYRLARKGITIPREPRTIQIYALRVLDLRCGASFECDLELKVSKGTYIRVFVEDLGAALGCGAHVQTLRRIGLAQYHEGKMISLEALRALDLAAQEACLLPVTAAISDWPVVSLSAVEAFYIQQGQSVQLPLALTAGWVQLHLGTQFLGIGEIVEAGRVVPRRLIRSP
jgi:tRNA pseudouridine55 synthase